MLALILYTQDMYVRNEIGAIRYLLIGEVER